MTAVQVRGIYATALTAVLDGTGHDVVAASDPIRERFDRAFPPREPDVRVATTDDRQGVGASGPAAAVDAVVEPLRDLAVDVFAWDDPAPLDAVFAGRVARTGSGGAVVDLGGAEGYLPYGHADEHVAEGDAVVVQVREPAPPWSDDRPLLGTELRATGTLATLVEGTDAAVAGTPRDADDLAGVVDLLDAEPPSTWGVRWEPASVDASIDALDGALGAAVERAAALPDDPSAAEAPARLAAPLATRWVWFGREARAACDDRRRAHAPTMAGHHRVKAAASAASDAVDLVERLGDPPAAFPFDAVTATFGPVAGDRVGIHHGKPDGRLLTLGTGSVTARDADAGSITVERELSGGGTYDALGVEKERGDVARSVFREGRWWYPTTYRDADDRVKGTYVNVCTPLELFPDAVRYVDLHVDVVRHRDGTVEIVDEDELADAVDAGDVEAELADRAGEVAASVAAGLRD